MRGECLCGSVKFEVSGAMPWLYQCHCSLCRKQGGSTSNTGLIIASGNFRWLAGRDGVSMYALPTGFRSWFCSTCGSTVPNPLRETDYVWVPSGLVEDTDQLKIGAHIYVGSKAQWDVLPEGGKRFDEMPGFPEFIAMLHNQGTNDDT